MNQIRLTLSLSMTSYLFICFSIPVFQASYYSKFPFTTIPNTNQHISPLNAGAHSTFQGVGFSVQEISPLCDVTDSMCWLRPLHLFVSPPIKGQCW